MNLRVLIRRSFVFFCIVGTPIVLQRSRAPKSAKKLAPELYAVRTQQGKQVVGIFRSVKGVFGDRHHTARE
jgi:uncharacterized protein (DUF2141 family)